MSKDWRDEVFALDSLSDQVDWLIEEVEKLRKDKRLLQKALSGKPMPYEDELPGIRDACRPF